METVILVVWFSFFAQTYFSAYDFAPMRNIGSCDRIGLEENQ